MKKIITYGTFDLFHQGHYNILRRAKELGDYLIVGVTTEHFDEARGKVNVVDSLMERIENVRSTGLADQIIVEDHDGQKIEDIQKYGVDTFVLGSDWKGTFDYLKAYCNVVYFERTPDVSSTMLRKDRFQIVRTGIVGTGRIAPRFMSEAKYVSGINMVSCYNPEQVSCENFASAFELASYTDSYADFLGDVDAVYIAAPNQYHYEYAKQALEAGRHVLCEKPLSFTQSQSRELYDLARDKGCVLMEAVKTAYCPGFQQVINVAKSGKIGEIKDVQATFTRLARPDSREAADAKYGGSFLEYGPYLLLPAIKLLGTEIRAVHFDTIYGPEGQDHYTSLSIRYDNAMAGGHCGVAVKSEGSLVIAGTKGYILVPSPWWLTKHFEVRYEDANEVETYEPRFLGDGLRYEIAEFVSQINGTEKNGYKLKPEEAIAMAGVTERYMRYRKLI